MASDLVPETPEIGSLTAHSNEDSQFVGSSSGVYFIKTVKRAFNDLGGSDSSETNFPTAEDTLVGPGDSPRQKRQRTASVRDRDTSTAEVESPTEWTYDPSLTESLGKLPPPELAKSLMMMYFQVWHPLFPFLHGPTFLQAMEKIYATNQGPPSQASCIDHRSTCWTTIFQCVFNLGSLLAPDLSLPAESKIQSPSCINSLLGALSSRHDIASLQALLAIQVYLVANMSLRQASTVGGCVLRSMLHAGLHRCPFRYKQLSTHDRQLRKRIFWCGYAIDRYLSQALGLPLGIQDSDIDVCLPAAREMHSLGGQVNQVSSDKTASPDFTEGDSAGGKCRRASHSQLDNRKEDYGKEAILASYVESGTLTGRALELFHKSILVRSVRRSSVLFLVTDVHKWWNGLPLDLQRKPSVAKHASGSGRADSPFDFSPFFTVLYQHLLLIIHRPSLSLDPSTAEFCSGLQTCIGAARSILSALRLQVHSRQALFWPGFLSAAWMSGLVLALACQLKQYVLAKGLQEISELSEFLRLMSGQWETASHCHISLSVLAAKINEAEDRGETTGNSQVYVRGVPGDDITLRDSLNAREERRRKLGDAHLQDDQSSSTDRSNIQQFDQKVQRQTGTDWEHSLGREHDFTGVPSELGQPANLDDQGISAATPSSMQMNFQDIHPTYLEGISNFDLNMVDLIEGANIDSLFDMVGQQFPSF